VKTLQKDVESLRVLLLEDNPSDADLSIRKLSEAGFEFHAEVARDSREFKNYLEKQSYDLILGDYRLPDWNGLDAVRWLRSSGILTPFLLVTGTLGDELAIECIKAGADDYVLKQNLERLPVAVRRALEEQQLRLERDWAERELRESEHQYRLLFHSNPHPMWVFDTETLRFLAVNDAAVHHYGYSVSEFLSMTIKDIRPSDEVPRLVQRVKDGTFGTVEHYHELWKHRTKDGSVIDVEISSQPIMFRSVHAALVLGHDVTEHRKLEQQFRYAQKMEAIGRLAGGVAHDFNNLLMVIASHVQLIKEHLGEPHRVNKYVNNVTGAIDRATLLTKQLLAFGRRQIQDLRVIDLNAIVPEFSKMLPALLGADIAVVVQTSPRECLVYSDKSQIEQVIMNLVVNARDAMPKGGTLTLETDRVSLGREYFPAHGVEAKAGEYVMLAVTDTGMGMDANTQLQVFEPFFTTKEVGKGTGLGLSTVYGIVKQSDGYIWLYSEVGIGTTFKVYLPYATAPLEMGEEPAPLVEESEARGTETILLVEDEAALLTTTAEFLESRGYRVLSAANAAEAIRASNSYKDEIHLLMTDLVMPGLGGLELSEKLTQLRPGLRVVYMSGYTEQTARPEAFERPRFYLQKPFSLSTLSAIARRALDAKQERPPAFSKESP
jgi:two-component system, cell cycle sensor histidine kinase and response regulator CckA